MTTRSKATPAMLLGKVNPKAASQRPADALNDKRVTIKAGAKATSYFRGGADLTGGHGHQGYVWMVDAASGKAVVDFGSTESGIALRVLANVADLEVVA